MHHVVERILQRVETGPALCHVVCRGVLAPQVRNQRNQTGVIATGKQPLGYHTSPAPFEQGSGPAMTVTVSSVVRVENFFHVRVRVHHFASVGTLAGLPW